MKVLITGAAGFIGYHVSKALLERGDEVFGIDNLNSYYDPSLKIHRLEALGKFPNLTSKYADIADGSDLVGVLPHNDFDTIVHLAAQAGVRHSLEAPLDYIRSNVLGHTVMLELARQSKNLKHFVYASSSSVYGQNSKTPFAITDRTDHPANLYAATKKSTEVISESYNYLFGIPMTGLRFFTVYGPFGRPDMAVWLFTKAIFEGRPVKLFNRGEMWRDFTYIDDIVAGVLAAVDRPPEQHLIYNLGNNAPVKISDLVSHIETAAGKKAVLEFEPMQAGDVQTTFADIEASKQRLGWAPKTTIQAGVEKFVSWYRAYHLAG